ncbi:Protein Mo25 [Portunus trituberculatus]|uniref:Protein Mo25 n=1 Tax=Portunus trituberculatus TaxID=210409 RepID=A0A5B7FAH8_PORTR|nr:Protein Mo25 [Portunus trituberculatus]
MERFFLGLAVQHTGKKDVAQIFNNILRRQIGIRSPTVEYICTKPEILFTLMKGYEHQDIALHCGTMLRECARYEALTRIILNSDDFYNFFKYVEVSTFDIASDAFSTFKGREREGLQVAERGGRLRPPGGWAGRM